MPAAEGDRLGFDGNRIKETVNNSAQAERDFVSVVSVFSSRSGLALGLEQFSNNKKI